MTSCLILISAQLCVISLPYRVTGMLDVNQREMQFVSDHLTNHKCHQLINALKQHNFQIKHDNDAIPTKPPDIEIGHQQEACIELLEKWGKDDGKNKTVEYLSLRLAEIGMTKLSSRLSSKVLKETSEELHQFFLDDPFKEMIPKKSAVVQDADDDENDDRDSSEENMQEDKLSHEDQADNLFAGVIIMITLGSTLMSAISVCLLCPKAGHFVCQRACPAPCAACYEITVEGCQRVWNGTRNGVNKYMLVTPTGAGTGGALAV